MRLIDADALFEREYARLREGEVLEYFTPTDIRSMPTVEERNKGKWEGLNQHGFFAREYKCTACESVVDMGCYTRGCDYDYCPYCGAEVEGEDG